MNVVTRAMVAHLKQGDSFALPAGSLLSPAARDLLRERRITVTEPPRKAPKLVFTPVPWDGKKGYVDHRTGRALAEKPEDMTHLTGNRLVPKTHPRILLRGRLDSLQAQVVIAQTLLEERAAPAPLVEELEDILAFLRAALRAEVLDEPLGEFRLAGLTPEALREQSHHPERYFGLDPMVLPHRSMGVACALLNGLRAGAREVELAADAAFLPHPTPAQYTILRGLNRLSSALHILFYRLLAGHYDH